MTLSTPPPKTISPVVLCILDGWGLRDDITDNAVALAATPHFDQLWATYPTTTLSASGLDVGLPEGQMGNSEVGHTNLGAGRVVMMDLPKIDAAIAEGSFAKRTEMVDFLGKTKAGNGAVHLLGLMSEGGVHAHLRHLIASITTFAAAGLDVYLHILLDGRDTPPQSALADLAKLEAVIAPYQRVRIATVTGRFYALDRDKRWERVQAAYEAIVSAKGTATPTDTAQQAIEAAYARGETDEFVQATVIGAYQGISAGDSLFMSHFRADRAREILSALTEPDFDGFTRQEMPCFTAALGMVEYSDALNQRMAALFPQEIPEDTLGAWVAAKGIAQFRVAETEKYPHVTFFFNGGEETPNPKEERYMAPSPKVKTYDLQPEMSASEVADALVEAILSQKYGLIVVNFANPDMVGHTGDLSAAMKAVEAVDQGLGRAVEAVQKVAGAMIVTADHGNCELMRDPETGEPHTAHTTNPVPVILLDAGDDQTSVSSLRTGGRLADIAPTILALMGLDQPEKMSGQSLLKN